ncbi:ATP-dependent Clp protease, ATP-binding subunit ClpX [Exophiala spinifera]|uniref:ATP-dependent Clp protease, ATP-binding subunit ClpX n=1 Tax=Exophiala spinifera TaxID=91928 RepID=A0A0D2B505_9EURO|nr:ATP-dependent Clp protease, ATP-binding subunit ClpX [Exophiala spinifera]KIW13780.1 ATP-dependent Clp protease, ATP-binding subunit ClpX [Exophiala spinifera]
MQAFSALPVFLCPALDGTMAASSAAIPYRLRTSYVALSRRSFSSSPTQPSSSQFHRSDFVNQPFTGSYEPGQPTSGPLGGASYTTPRLTPKMLKQHLDQFVVGQERSKKVLSVAVFNHYQRIQELQRREEEEEELMAQRERRERHPVEDEFPGQQSTVRMSNSRASSVNGRPSGMPLIDTSPLTLDKSNILLLGPSGVGKTLMAKTLARVLSVPFSMSDCTPFTQAGYIGEDAEVCVHRLLAAANYDVERAERGIICLDEVDKIATAKVSHGKDVSGEGVQQALLKIIEGTTIQIQAKPERNAPRAGGQSQSYPTNSPLGAGFSSGGPGAAATPAKGEVYNVRTDNILFIFSGAFVGLQKHVLDRLTKGSIGFGASVRSSSNLRSYARDQKSTDNAPVPILPGSQEEELYRKHLPFFTPTPSPDDHTADGTSAELNYFNPLDLVTPADLQSYGFIPELIGRIPTTTALSALTHSMLLRILTEPRNSLVAQYVTLFSLSGIELRFTTPALHVVASNALTMGTGARALRTEMETILGDAMFEAPGSSVKYVLVTERVAKREEGAVYFGRGQGGKFHAMIAQEEGDWEDQQKRRGPKKSENMTASFEDWRTKTTMAVGSGG